MDNSLNLALNAFFGTLRTLGLQKNLYR